MDDRAIEASRIARWCVKAATAPLFCFAALVGFTPVAQAVQPAQDQIAGRWQDVTFDAYRAHLTALMPVTRACAVARNVNACDPRLIGEDDRVLLGDGAHTERRIIRYAWLRVLFVRAEEPDAMQEAAKLSRPGTVRSDHETTSQMLVDAEARLAYDLAQANAPLASAPSHVHDREVLQQVLAGHEFRNLKQPDERSSAMEMVANWLNHLFESFDRLRARSAWVGRALIWGFLLAVGAALAWSLMGLERRWRLRIAPAKQTLDHGTVSALDWQLNLDMARQAAAAGRWREAIHFVYWAAIARMESKRLWPADKARTPREYLALMTPGDPRGASLAALTSAFERTWYGGRAASEDDYRRAEAIAAGLIAGKKQGDHAASAERGVA